MTVFNKGRKTNTFSRQHWLVIIMGFVLFYCCNACMTDGMNVIAPTLAAERGWDYTYILSFATLSGCVSVGICSLNVYCYTVLLSCFLISFLHGYPEGVCERTLDSAELGSGILCRKRSEILVYLRESLLEYSLLTCLFSCFLRLLGRLFL